MAQPGSALVRVFEMATRDQFATHYVVSLDELIVSYLQLFEAVPEYKDLGKPKHHTF